MAGPSSGDIGHEDTGDGRNYEKAANRRQQHAADDHARQRLLDLRADAGGNRGGEETDTCGKTGHESLPHPSLGGTDDCLVAANPLIHVPADVGDEQDAVHCGHTEQRNESDGGGNAKIKVGDVKPQNSPRDRERNASKGEQAVAHRGKQAIQKH